MRRTAGHRKATRMWILSPVALTLPLAATVVLGADPAAAHGKEVRVEISSLTFDAGQPLTRLYHAVVTFEGDGDPVEDGEIDMTAVRAEDGTSAGPFVLAPLEQPGRYAAEVTYERFGTYEVTVRVRAPGEGEATFVDAVVPGVGASASDEPRSPSSETLAVLFRFDGGDVANIVVRVAHALAGAAWVALVAVVAVGGWLQRPDAGGRLLARVRPYFTTVAATSLAVILASGVHASIYGTPIRDPGIFDLDTLLSIPFGGQYFAAFVAMALAWPVMVAVTVRLRRALRGVGADGVVATSAVRAPAAAGLATSVFLAVDITVLLYIHNISHLSLVIPQ